jgi:hypothetical protein
MKTPRMLRLHLVLTFVPDVNLFWNAGAQSQSLI